MERWEEKWSVEEKEWEEINGILRFEFPFLCVIRWHARKIKFLNNYTLDDKI